MDTIIAPITGMVGGSVHLVRISGPQAFSITKRFFNNDRFSLAKGNRIFYGKLVNEQNKLIDDVLVLFFKGPHSYTGEDVVEISCHGNYLITEQIIELFLRNGARLAEAGEFTKRAFLNGRMDLLQAESIAALISARSDRALKAAQKLLAGGLSKEIVNIRQQLIDILAQIELDLDFSEEDIEIISREGLQQLLGELRERFLKLIEGYEKGRFLYRGIEVLITGKPNVGKSSLMNALLEQDRVLVSDIPGTTRDFIHDEIYLDNVLVKFIDSAGIRESTDALEVAGVKRAHQLIERVDLVLCTLDASSPLDNEDRYLLSVLEPFYKKTIFVANKTDLPKHDKFPDNIAGKNTIKISALAKKNLVAVKNEIKKLIHMADQQEVTLNNERQYQLIKKSLQQLDMVKSNLDKNLGFEFIAFELREVLQNLAELIGEVSNEEILNNIFANFCIGK